MRTPPLRKNDTWDTWFIRLLDKAFPDGEITVNILYIVNDLTYCFAFFQGARYLYLWHPFLVGDMNARDRRETTRLVEEAKYMFQDDAPQK